MTDDRHQRCINAQTLRDITNIESMAPRLFDLRMHDGSRHFAGLPMTRLWYDVRDHVENLDGAVLTGFITDHVTEAWIDFTYAAHRFSINDQHGEYWFFVEDPACPDAVLLRVLRHFERLLGDE